MYVHWKTLVVLGFTLWIVLCLTDILYDDYGSKKYLTSDEFNWMRDVPEEELIYVPPNVKDTLEISESDLRGEGGFGFGLSLIFWNCIAFLSSIALCSFLRNGVLMLLKRYFARMYVVRTTSSPEVLTLALRSSPSRIPIRRCYSCEDKSSTFLGGISETDFEPTRDGESIKQQSCLDLSPSSSSHEDSQNKIQQEVYLSKLLEKQRLLLREEMLAAQAASLKEHAMLSRKLEAVLREKRELSKQLAVAHKENRAAKQQLEELLCEKTCFLKKLETATKQLKANNKTKKLAFAKLEESQAVIVNLKQQLEKVLKEKDVLQRKIITLEEELDRLKMDTDVDNIPVKSSSSESEKKDSKEHAVDQRITDESLDLFIGNEIEEKASKPSPTISETEIDMQKIQMKIMALEKNLEKFSSRKLMPVAPMEPETTTTSKDSKESTTINYEEEDKMEDDEGTEGDAAETEETSNEEKNNHVMVYKEVFVRKVNEGDSREKSKSDVTTKRVNSERTATRLPRRIFKPPPKDISCAPLYKIPEEITLNKKFNFEFKGSSQGHVSVRTEDSTALLTSPNSYCSTTTSLVDNEDTSSEDCNAYKQKPPNKKRLVSSSPAFQKFLKTLDSQEK